MQLIARDYTKRKRDGSKAESSSRLFYADYHDRVRAFRRTSAYEKVLLKRRVWVELSFAEARDRYGMRRFRPRKLEEVTKYI
jgi:hypothetical protein